MLGLKLHPETPLIKHFTNFDDLITELLAAGAKLEEGDKVSHLLITLPTSYDGVITAIETLSEENLTLAFVKTRLLDQEIKLKRESADTSGKVLQAERDNNYVMEQKKNVKPFRNEPYKRHFSKVRKAKNIKCYHCGRIGHIKKDCYHYKRQIQHQKNSNSHRTVQAVQVEASTSSSAGFAFMTGQLDVTQDENTITFLLDSGASDHIINRDDLFSNFIYLDNPMKISVAKAGSYIQATKRGSIKVVSNMGIEGVLENVLYCPEVPHNLLSVSRMQNAGMTVLFKPEGVEIHKHGKPILKGKPFNNLFSIDFTISSNVESVYKQVSTAETNESYKLWHQRLGHIGKLKFSELKRNRMFEDLDRIVNVIPDDDLCEACIKGKQAHLPFEKAKDKSHINRPLFVVHSDVCGPITPCALSNKNYYVTFIDDFTHYCVTYLIEYKSDVFTVFQDFVSKSESHFNLKLVNLYLK